MIKAVIFDMDGVIVDSISIHYGAWKIVAKRHHFEIDRSFFDELNGMDTPLIARHIIDKYSLQMDPIALSDEKRSISAQNLIGGVKLFDGVSQILAGLRKNGYKIGLATSTNREHTIMTLGKNIKLFDSVITDDDIINPKPAPDIFMKCAESLGVSYENCIVVEDSINGIMAAKKAGMKGVAITNTTSAEKFTMADAVISKIEELDDRLIKHLGE